MTTKTVEFLGNKIELVQDIRLKQKKKLEPLYSKFRKDIIGGTELLLESIGILALSFNSKQGAGELIDFLDNLEGSEKELEAIKNLSEEVMNIIKGEDKKKELTISSPDTNKK